MGSPFLEGFTASVLRRLLEEGLIDIEPGTSDEVVAEVAAGLGKSRDQSLVSLMVQAFIACESVVELYAEDEQLKALITDLGLR